MVQHAGDDGEFSPSAGSGCGWPARTDKDLRQLENVVLTPHIGSNTREANRRMAESALENVRSFFAGKLDQLARVDQP